jgi:hypothetical protein
MRKKKINMEDQKSKGLKLGNTITDIDIIEKEALKYPTKHEQIAFIEGAKVMSELDLKAITRIVEKV